jgi:signal transduction histidine kinase
MDLVTIVWSCIGAASVTLAAVHGLAWLLDRRSPAYLLFFCLAISVACIARVDIALMHAGTPAEYGEWVRWYHLPSFAFLTTYVLFLRAYLGTGRAWLAWTIIAARSFVVIVNFLVQPNFTYQAILTLRRVSFLGEHVSAVGQATMRSWQWLASATVVLIILFAIDAVVQRWRMGGKESRRTAIMVACGMVLPLSAGLVYTQLKVLLGAPIPLLDTPLFLVTLAVMTFEISRAVAARTRMQEELTRLRADVARSERVTALGQLASALAHEISQPLHAIRINTEAAEQQLSSEQPDLRELRSIVTSIRQDDTRAGTIVDRIRAFIKGVRVDVRPLPLGELLQDVISLVQSEAHLRGISLDCVTEAGLTQISGDRVLVSQVLLNLILNAMEAMQASSAKAPQLHIEARTAADKVEIAVSDSGPGIAPGDLDRIFDPLFSTKSDGLGMGLAISRTIIESHGGRLWAQNRATGSGATFAFTLPIAGQRAPVSLPDCLPQAPT